MSWLFYNCTSLISVNLSNFETQNVKNMDYIFYYCKSLTLIDISNFITNKKMVYLFKELPDNGTIRISSHSQDKFKEIPSGWEIDYL